MSHPRRSLVRSSLENLRRLWQRRKSGRREMRRQLGTTFEMLEPRLAMTISAPLPPVFPAANSHIHPTLTIIIDGQQVVIPAGIGINGSSFSNPHTHDYSGKLRIGEGAIAGTDSSGSASRNVTLQDFFNVWASSTATQASARNANALLDTDPNDGTAQPRIMNKTVDSTHVLRMYVKESGDSAPELEYDSSSSSNGVARPELYVPRDGDQVIFSYDKITQTADTPSFDTISNQTVLGGAPTWLGINGFDPSGGPLTYTVTSTNPGLLQAVVQPSSNKSLVLNTSSSALEGGFGQMVFQLFDNLEPRTTQHIETIVNNGEFANNATFYRIANSGSSPFVIQGGPSNTTSSLGQFDDEFNADLQFTTAGLLAMAKSSDDTNDAQIFVTAGPTRFLDFQHSIFGVLTEGEAVRQAIQASRTSGDGPPPNTITITGAQIITDTQNAALMLKAAAGASGQADVTLTVKDAQNHTYSQTFHVTVTPDSNNPAPFLNPISPVTGVANQPINLQLAATDVQNKDGLFFDASVPTGETAITASNISVNHTTGLVTITPPTGFVGTFHVLVGVRGASTRTTSDQFDTQNVLVTVGAGSPSSIDLATASDSGASNSDNITNASSLDFTISGVTTGATVKLLKGSTILAQGQATGTSITLTIANPGSVLSQGANAITATQTVNGQESAVSTALNVTYDTTSPSFTSTAPTTAPVGFNLNYDANTDEEGGTTGLTYSLTSNSVGASINSSTGVVTWTPTSAQTGTKTFTIVATDAAGNTASQNLSVTVDTPKVDIQLTLTKPDGSPLTSLAIGQDFVLHVFGQDVRNDPHGVFALYTDITFDGTKATITGPITYSNTYGSGHSGTTGTGLVDEVGAFAGTTETGADPKEVFSVPMRATGSGIIKFLTDPADTQPQHAILQYNPGSDPQGSTPIPSAQVHFGAASIEISPTFNAVNDTFNVTEDTQTNTLNPLANDTNIGSNTNTLTISAVGAAGHGTVTISSDSKTLIYTPTANFTGADTFTYTAKNQNNETHTATITVNVGDANDAPVANNDTFSAPRNSTGNVLNVLANDTLGPDTGETLRVTAVGTGNHGGTITIGTNGANIIYTPAANFSGTETFTYTISDRATGGLTSQATVTVNVSGLTANNDSGTGFTVNEDSSAQTLDVLANDVADSQVPNSVLTITAVGTTDHGGTVTITQNNTRLSYTPAANFQGTEKFTYTISDGQGHNATATVTMTVNNLNDPPTAVNDTLTAFKDTQATFDVLANDTSSPDPTETLTLDSITAAPQHGTATIVNGKVQYTPTSGYTGADSFTYQIKDAGGLTSTATANITVQEFTPSTLSGFVYFDTNNNGVKDANEVAIAGITITLTGTATAGSNTQANGINVTAKTGEDGSYKFESLAPGNYTIKETQPMFVTDGKVTAGSQGGTAGTNQITISTLAQGTTGTNNNFGERGRALTTFSLRDLFSSTSTNYAYAAFDNSGAEMWHATTGSVWQGYTKNTFSLNNSQNLVLFDSTTPQSQVITTRLNTSLPVYQAGASGSNKLYYIPGGLAGTVGNASPSGTADTYSATQNTALTVNAANGVLKNDTDPEGKTLTASKVTDPAHGTLTLNSDGSFTYTPTTGFTGTDTFAYKASDGSKQSAATTVTITVAAANATPTALADTFSATEDTTLTVTTANGVLKNDTGSSLTASLVTQASKGTVTLAADGSFTYVPNANATGTDTFTYKAVSGSNQSTPATVTITIAAQQDAPVANTDTFSTFKNVALTTGNLITNDTDADGDTFTVVTTPVTAPQHGQVVLNANGTFTYTPTSGFVGTDTFQYKINDTHGDSFNVVTTPVTQPGHGTVTLSADGSFVYHPAANFNGTDTFTYKVNDGANDSNVATVTINVTAVNDAPVGQNDQYRVAPNTNLTVNTANGVLKNDSDVDGVSTSLSAVIVTQPTHGTVALNLDGSFTYTSSLDSFSGNDTFTYKVKDDANPQAESTPVTVVIVVNSAPVANNDPNTGSYTTNEDTALTIDAPGVLNNDSDVNGDPMTAVIVQQPANGTVTLNANGSFTYTPNANFNGTDTFRYQATDGTSASAPATVTITVNPVNDVPSFTLGAANPVNEDAGEVEVANFAGNLSAGPANESSQTLSFTTTVTAVTGTLTFVTPPSIDATGKLTYHPAADTNGTATVTVVLHDNGSGTAPNVNTSAAQTFTITVNAVNDAPSFTIDGDPAAINEDASAVTVDDFITNIVAGPTDESGQTLTFGVTVTGTTGNLAFTTPPAIDADGNLTYTVAPNTNGTATVSVVLTDNGLSAAPNDNSSSPQTFTITVNPINDAPSFTIAANPPAVSDNAGDVTENNFVTNISAGPSDESSQTLTFTPTVTSTTGNLAFSTLPAISATGVLTYSVTAGTSGTATVSVILTDSGSNAAPNVNVSAAQTFTITVNPAGSQEGEGEAAGTSANDLGLLYFLALSNNTDHVADSDQIDDGMWQDAVDEAMAQLG